MAKIVKHEHLFFTRFVDDRTVVTRKSVVIHANKKKEVVFVVL